MDGMNLTFNLNSQISGSLHPCHPFDAIGSATHARMLVCICLYTSLSQENSPLLEPHSGILWRRADQRWNPWWFQGKCTCCLHMHHTHSFFVAGGFVSETLTETRTEIHCVQPCLLSGLWHIVSDAVLLWATSRNLRHDCEEAGPPILQFNGGISAFLCEPTIFRKPSDLQRTFKWHFAAFEPARTALLIPFLEGWELRKTNAMVYWQVYAYFFLINLLCFCFQRYL